MLATHSRHLVVLGLALVASSGHSFSFGSAGFDSADANKDGVIDRGEYKVFAGHVAAQMTDSLGVPKPALPTTGGEGGDPSSPDAHSVDFPVIGSLDSPQFLAAFINSLIMIIVTELGDKTFFIAAVLAMRQDRWAIFLGAWGALVIMTILSAGMGFALPNLLPKEYTHFMSALLFLYFGLRLLKDASDMESNGQVSDELQEVEEELVGKKSEEGASHNDEEEGDFGSKDRKKNNAGGSKDATATGRILTQAFTLTFLAEWGDRSQIATIAMASKADPFGVTLGGVVGHGLCTGLAVVGGRMLAARISEKTVATVGGVTFLAFALHSFLYPDAFD